MLLQALKAHDSMLGPVVQSVIRLTSSLRVISLTVLADSIFNILLGFSPLWFEPSSGHMWESQVLLTDGQVVFLRVLRFSPTFDERSARYK